ncbi:UTP--glucose-1-phosphate uridylyltransferase GalU [Pallidibacillus thermolactis]|uniref:UTP--glucose-1-phosphate uridylyltransferase GalU n=1 Tax=Pallidibacillus thermolactis TaxID=251051 RepID=UPI0021DA2185|nr:UTP--glucose-1-phosphate uridylyltransferase GalU [Pallidibacillus thermolactis]MCU9600047.1 UTP--glucose-1-phosphate uridylyltransferase GalU [Pallidibacillus thermolactis subsp. kokeshiiformis]
MWLKKVIDPLKIRKAIIPAAGLGTRFLPATKAMPKEMLPIIDQPTIQYIVEEAVEAGIKDIIIVTGKGKRAIEDHFDYAFELEETLIKRGKLDLLEKVRHPSEVEIHYIRQKEPKGLGHAIWCARKFIGEEPFAVLLGDDIFVSEQPSIKQLIDVFRQKSGSVIGVEQVAPEVTERYGIVEPGICEDRIYEVLNLVEKPVKGQAPSNIAVVGRYVLTPEIFPVLEFQQPGADGEIQLTDALQTLNQFQRVYAYEIEGKRYDIGNKFGYIKTLVEFALQRDDLRDDVLKFVKEKLLKE